jgi:hypothetical protein
MIKYVKIYNEFLRFVDQCSRENVTLYERKIINLIIKYFDNIADAGTAHGKRAILLNELIQKDGSSIPSALMEIKKDSGTNLFPFSYLTSIEIESFRGFTEKEIIPLDKRYTFVYGPNGSGKTSFCEALEYSMLGYIDEAISRRIDLERYIRNSFTGLSKKPILKGKASDETIVAISPNQNLLNFCFVEKNRIEDFGRIPANTPGEKQALLASLFGLTEFNDFIGNFTKNISEYIDTQGRKQIELSKKESEIKIHSDNIIASEKQINDQEKRSVSVAEGFDPKFTFEALIAFINGTPDKKGRIAEIQEKLQMPTLKSVEVILLPELDEKTRQLKIITDESKIKLSEFISKKYKVRFLDLYKAIMEVQTLSDNVCPACDTPISKVTNDPYAKAQSKLLELKEVADLENRINDLSKIINDGLKNLSEILINRANAAKALSVYSDEIEFKGREQGSKEDLNSLNIYFETLNTFLKKSRNSQTILDAIIKKKNDEASGEAQYRKSLSGELSNLNNISRQIQEIQSAIKTHQKQIINWKLHVEEFKKNNEKLIKEAQAEKPVVEENKKYVDAYQLFCGRISKYKDTLPLQNLSELNSLTLEIYNEINEGDREFEKAAKIVLPSTPNDAISISFKGNPTQMHDALHILSEGHIRILGLAILLAKNIHNKCPVLVFDDVVNAIDDDHRGGVRQALFTNANLKSKQILITTHAEQFVKELEQHVTKPEYDNIVNKIHFIVDMSKRMIRVKYDSHENYLHKIETACNNSNWSSALYNSRCCLENLSHRLWKRLGKLYKTEFTVVIRAPGGIPDLMSVVNSLHKYTKKINSDDKYSEILQILEYFLGLNSKSSICWQYLNKGTHEEEGKLEFDHLIVREIWEKLKQLDIALKYPADT